MVTFVTDTKSALSDGRDHAEQLLFLRAVNYRKVFELKVKNRLL